MSCGRVPPSSMQKSIFFSLVRIVTLSVHCFDRCSYLSPCVKLADQMIEIQTFSLMKHSFEGRKYTAYMLLLRYTYNKQISIMYM